MVRRRVAHPGRRDEALAASPDIAEKIRGGKVQAVGSDRRRGDEGDQGSG